MIAAVLEFTTIVSGPRMVTGKNNLRDLWVP